MASNAESAGTAEPMQGAEPAGTAEPMQGAEPAGTAGAIESAQCGQTWTIAEIAEEFEVTHRTVRYYEDKGLISPERRGTQRVFHPRDRVRLALVLRGKRLGFPLDEIATIVNMYDETPGEAGQLRYLLDQIDARRADLEHRRADIEAALAELRELERRCSAQLADLHSRPAPAVSE